MDRWEGQVAVITGASAGIGAAIAEELVELGLKVVGVARRKEKLEELGKKLENKKGKFYPFVADVAKEEDIIKAFAWVKENVGIVHILINNAGIARFSTSIEGNSQHMHDVFNTNVFGLIIATREAIKEMKNNNIDGHIIHINSVLGHKVIRGGPSAMYPASKHSVTALTEILRNELSIIKSKIKISSISPGIVDTEIIDVAAADGKETSGSDTDKPKLAMDFKNVPTLYSKDVADAVVYVLSTPPHVQIHELTIKPIGEQF